MSAHEKLHEESVFCHGMKIGHIKFCMYVLCVVECIAANLNEYMWNNVLCTHSSNNYADATRKW